MVTRVDKDAPDSPEQCKEADKNCLAVFGVLNTFGVDVDAKRNTPTAVLFDTIIKYLPGGVGTKVRCKIYFIRSIVNILHSSFFRPRLYNNIYGRLLLKLKSMFCILGIF